MVQAIWAMSLLNRHLAHWISFNKGVHFNNNSVLRKNAFGGYERLAWGEREGQLSIPRGKHNVSIILILLLMKNMPICLYIDYMLSSVTLIAHQFHLQTELLWMSFYTIICKAKR